MSATAEHGEREPRTLAEKLQWLRVLRTPEGGKPISYQKMATQILEQTGVSISHTYLWNLAKGKAANPALDHMEAIAAWGRIPLVYLTGGPGFEQLEVQLELLSRLKTAGVKDIKLDDVTGNSADPDTIQTLVGRLQLLQAFGDSTVQEAAVQIGGLELEQQQTLQKVLKDSALLDALQSDEVRQVARSANGLSAQLLPSATNVLEDKDLLCALDERAVREIAQQAASLSLASQQAVLTMIDQLQRIEQSSTPTKPRSRPRP